MARIRTTKNELKAQRDTLRRFERYLPTLQLKKTQLQLEVRQVEARLEQNERREQAQQDALRSWVELFSDPVEFGPWLGVSAVATDVQNIAGVNVPVLRAVDFRRAQPDLRTSP